MPSIQSLVLTDRQGTPVNFTLLPIGEKDGVATVAVADATGATITEKRFSISSKRVGDRIRSTIKFKVPTVVTEVINGVSDPVVAREAFVDATFTFSSKSTEAERNDVVGMFASALAVTKPLVHDTLVKGQAVW
jgi:hypothetical protein